MLEPSHAKRHTWQPLLDRWTLRRSPAQRHHTLEQRNLYVLPSAAGYMLAATLLLLLIASINFQLNLGYALTFLVAGSALASLWMGHRNMRGLDLSLGTLSPIFQGQCALIPVRLEGMHGLRERHAISLAIHHSQGSLAWVHTDLPQGQASTVELGYSPYQRGWHLVPRIVVESRFPLGVFRLWSSWQPAHRRLVYPAPESPCPPIHRGEMEDAPTPHARPIHSTEPDGVRSYQRGDALRSVVWKKAATALATGSGDLVVRHSAATFSHTLWLDAHATGLSDTEAQISRLTAWVLHAHAQQWQWGLKLPSGQHIAPAAGTQHLQSCLAALAIDGLPHSEI